MSKRQPTYRIWQRWSTIVREAGGAGHGQVSVRRGAAGFGRRGGSKERRGQARQGRRGEAFRGVPGEGTVWHGLIKTRRSRQRDF